MPTLPFAAFVGMERLKKALLTLAVDPNIGGLLIVIISDGNVNFKVFNVV